MLRALAAVVAIFLTIYLPDAGHGFIADDFRWIVESRVASTADLVGLFAANLGFYRPAASLSFAVDRALWDSHAFGYGLTNIALCLAVAAALYAVARRLRLPAAAAILAAGVWLLNFHAINMAVLWTSGRTALLAALFSLATAWAALRGRHVAGGVFALAAMLSKEEAVALPALFTLHPVLVEGKIGRLRTVVPLWIALGVYMTLRLQSGAFWPADAPSFYQFTFEPAAVARNLLEYADRAGTVFAIVAIALVLTTRIRWRDVTPGERGVLTFAGLWIAAMYGLTLFLPVRSSLYALLPSLGSALALGAVAASAHRHHPLRFRRSVIGLLIAAVLLVPIYRARNARWVRLAELTERTLATIAADAGGRAGGHVVLIDDPDERFDLAAAFGNLFPEALRLRVGSGWTGEIVTTASEDDATAVLVYGLEDGRLIAKRRPLPGGP